MKEKELFRGVEHPNLLNSESRLKYTGSVTQINYLTENYYCNDRHQAEVVVSTALRTLRTLGTNRRIYAGETIYTQIDRPHNLVLIESGLAFAFLDNSRGNRFVGEIIEGTTIAGTEKSSMQPERTNTLEAMTQCEIQIIDNNVVGKAMRKVPELGLFFLATQSIRNQKRDERMSRMLLYNKTKQRVAFTLLELAKYEEELGAVLLNQARIGELSGCTRESANRTLIDLKKRKIIDYTQHLNNKVLHLKINKPEELEELIDEI